MYCQYQRIHSKGLWTLLRRKRLHFLITLILVAVTCTIFWNRKGKSGPLTGNPDSVRRLPQAIIIGTRKSGTRALLKFLEINPSVRAASKEVHFFDRQSNYRHGLAWYKSQMPESSPGELTIEKSPAYFVTRGVAERIYSMNSSVRLIVIFRDPVNRLISDLSQLVANKLEPIFSSVGMGENRETDDYYKDEEQLDLLPLAQLAREKVSSEKETITELVWSEAGRKFEASMMRDDGGINDQYRAIRIGMYSMYLERWLAVFPRQQIHFVNGERLITNPAEELQKLEKFLALEPYIKQEHFVFDPRKGFYCLNVTLASSTHDHQKTTRTAAPVEPRCLSKSKGRRHVKLSKKMANQLRDFYQPYNDYLHALTDINFNNM